MLLILLPLGGYLLGSVSSAVLVSKLMGLPDPRQSGSGNPGATNVLRLGNKPAAALTLLGDVLKGVLPVLIAKYLDADTTGIALAGLGAFLGHLFPVFFGFAGGKGVATSLGIFLALNPLIAGSQVALWALMALVFRYSSLAALVTALATPILLFLQMDDPVLTGFGIILAALLVFRHRANIVRLVQGNESKIQLKKRRQQ
ncbi:MAG TPA: glycerol-3-phosphate 1-O-acyltransferase [Gammaproteobacteria bacterium]|nr:glycerol-3-phosphate 1-O-acyltransferase [Gammaproteobacteria bacterium]